MIIQVLGAPNRSWNNFSCAAPGDEGAGRTNNIPHNNIPNFWTFPAEKKDHWDTPCKLCEPGVCQDTLEGPGAQLDLRFKGFSSLNNCNFPA